MIYLDHGATSFPKPERVRRAVLRAMEECGNPGRGGYEAAARAEKTVYHCREAAGALFGCRPEQVVMTGSEKALPQPLCSDRRFCLPGLLPHTPLFRDFRIPPWP